MTDPLAVQAPSPWPAHEMAGATFGGLAPQDIRTPCSTCCAPSPVMWTVFRGRFGTADEAPPMQ
ncbi:MAG: hypothetical protein R2838_07325 [Caldilineaceae bacterium]